MKKLISIVVPCYNEEESILPFFESLKSEIQKIKQYNFEVIFVNDGSKDRTGSYIEDIAKENEVVKGVNFSRNFGKEIALTAGLESASGDAIITIDADGQHPVEKISAFINEWKQGYDIVYNKRPKTEGVSFGKKISSAVFYGIFNKISSFKLEAGTTDYRLLDKKVVREFLRFSEKNRLYRGLTDWLGFKKKALIFDAQERLYGGTASYSYKNLFQLAINSMTSFSFFPLKLVGYLGALITFFSGTLFVLMLIDMFLINFFSFTPISVVVVFNTVLMGIVMSALGLIALYIAHIHEEVLGRPMYVVQEKINFK